MSKQNKTGAPVELRGSMYSKPGMGVTSLLKGKSVQSSPDKNIKTWSKPVREHAVVGDAPSEPHTTRPRVHPQQHHSNPNANPEGSGGPNQPKSRSRETVSPAPPRGPRPKTQIPSSGRVEAQLGHAYPRTPVREAVADKGAHHRSVTPQIASSTPVAVPANQKNKNS
jgi:hypothetical protein